MTTEQPHDSAKKRREQELIEGFCQKLGARIASFEPAEHPDAFVRLCGEGWPAHVGIEVEEYHMDPKIRHKGSLGRRHSDACGEIQDILAGKPKPSGLQEEGAAVVLKPHLVPCAHELHGLADEVLEYASDAVAQLRWSRGSHTRFCAQAYPLLSQYVSMIQPKPLRASATWICKSAPIWSSPNTANLEAAIAQKNDKAKGHRWQWRGVNERWLLVVAGADYGALVTYLGVKEFVTPKLTRLKSDVKGAIRSFERVFIYERAFNWIDELYRGRGIPDLPWRTEAC